MSAVQQRAQGGKRGKGRDAHIGILSIDTCSGHHTGLLLVLIESKWVSVDISLYNTEAGLVCNAIAISKGGWAGIVVSGHIMEKGKNRGNNL